MSTSHIDVLLVGAGAMSSTLGMLLKILDPELTIKMVERLDKVAEESTNGWNNAGTGHAAYCELNYTPEMPDGSIETKKAHQINSAFETSLQFWSWLVSQNKLPAPQQFINATPHMSFVWGQDNVDYLRERHALLTQHHQFKDMEFSDNPEQLIQWMPLVMQGRDANEPVAATRINYGTDVNFGALSRFMIENLSQEQDFELFLQHSVEDLEQQEDGQWRVEVKDEASGTDHVITASFVFIGAGGASLPLLQKSDIPEASGYGGFPVSGQWLVCDDPDIVSQHYAKVYGKAEIGAPPMSVPHLDTRIIDGHSALLFGPFAGFTTKFLKQGSVFDIIGSMTLDNIKPMLSVGMDNMDLTKYLIAEAMQSMDDRIESLKKYYPEANKDQWRLATAGQRVQIIKQCDDEGGKLEFGTEVVTAQDGSLAALLGASPGASTTVDAMLGVLQTCFADKMAEGDWEEKIKTMIPSYGESLTDDAELLERVRDEVLTTLALK